LGPEKLLDLILGAPHYSKIRSAAQEELLTTDRFGFQDWFKIRTLSQERLVTSGDLHDEIISKVVESAQTSQDILTAIQELWVYYNPVANLLDKARNLPKAETERFWLELLSFAKKKDYIRAGLILAVAVALQQIKKVSPLLLLNISASLKHMPDTDKHSEEFFDYKRIARDLKVKVGDDPRTLIAIIIKEKIMTINATTSQWAAALTNYQYPYWPAPPMSDIYTQAREQLISAARDDFDLLIQLILADPKLFAKNRSGLFTDKQRKELRDMIQTTPVSSDQLIALLEKDCTSSVHEDLQARLREKLAVTI